jgi:hypothetical protein
MSFRIAGLQAQNLTQNFSKHEELGQLHYDVQYHELISKIKRSVTDLWIINIRTLICCKILAYKQSRNCKYVKVSIILMSRRENIQWGWSIAPHIINLGTRQRLQVSFTPRPLHPGDRSPGYPLHKRLGGPQERSAPASRGTPVIQPIAPIL